MLKHTAIATMTVVRLPIAVEVVDGRDTDMDNIVMITRLAAVLGDEANSIPMVLSVW